MPVTVSVPATTANLGPGYDCIAMALHPRCRVTAIRSGEWTIEHIGPEILPGDSEDIILEAARSVAEGPLALTVANEIPIGKGLGSSAAALTAGVSVATAAMGGAIDRQQVFERAAAMEGHPEQVAAAIYGGLILISASGEPIPLTVHPSLRVLVAVPDETLSTHEARTVVPSTLPIDVVVRSLARMGALAAGLLTGDPVLLGASRGDEVHEEPRARVSPRVGELADLALEAGAWHVARSGAGPSVLALVGDSGVDAVRSVWEQAGVRVLLGPIDTDGLVVTSV